MTARDRNYGLSLWAWRALPPAPPEMGVSRLEAVEKYAILRAVWLFGGSTARAAKQLGISQRTVQYRVKEWGFDHPPRRNS